ncbi:High cysteine membrane protein Group 5 [Giardia duodenalis]|uniref:High cysteine membrane protein Group 5 n=1 Tax=Giardia intestinalis (strain ATCC 50803 / WB clone C6) TaxID=184922 RepID=A0A644F4V5_GIAIC|nr:High cysteine membrane protein Group 5 [Giardia intestinalis]KAE8303656.1 High cysteine membrane protein Group 5 [Giardia intestinalis]
MHALVVLVALATAPSRGGKMSCPKNHYLTGSMCVECAAAIKWCLECTGAGACTRCASGAYLEGGYCKPCDPTCERCTGPGKCTACSEAHCRAQDGTCKEPKDLYTGCSKCVHDTGKCMTCAEGYFHSGAGSTPCTKCADNCLSCKSATECTRAASGYYVNPSTKSPAACTGTNCDTCADDGACTVCKPGYRLSTPSTTSQSATCVSCTGNCSTCDSSKCTFCMPGYALTSDSTCQACQQGCAICADDERQFPGKCLSTGCAQGYYYHSYAKVCAKCPTNCADCYYDEAHSIPVCTRCTDSSQLTVGPKIYGIWCSDLPTKSCKSNEFLENGFCVPCYGAIMNCIGCSDRFRCTECLPGYYLYDNLCVRCDDNCLACENTATNCTNCDDGFVLQNGTCVKVGLVIENCLHADNTTDPTKGCSTCRGGFYVADGACKKCVDNCQLCKGPEISNCILGFNGYRYDSYKNTLEKCEDPNCELCAETAKYCGTCKLGFYISPDDQKCAKGQVENCKVYTYDGSACSECLAGYGISVDGDRCSPCLEGCKGECTDTTCESGVCVQGYYFAEGDTCLTCPSECASYMANSKKLVSCDRCTSGQVFAISSVMGLYCGKLDSNFSSRGAGLISTIVILGLIIVGFIVATPFLVKLAKKRGVRVSKLRSINSGSESHNEFLLEEPDLL